MLTSIEFNDGLSDFDDFRNEDDSTFFERKQWEYMFGQVGLDIVAAYPEEGEAFLRSGAGNFCFGSPEPSYGDKYKRIACVFKAATRRI